MRTQVGIVGGGPAGLLLAHLLHLRGIDSVVLEARSEEYVVDRVRAGVLEQGTVDLMAEIGLGDRMKREGLIHRGINISFAGALHRIDLHEMTGGRAITVYGQNEVQKDLNQARRATDQSARKAIYDEVQQILAQDEPYINLWYNDNVCVHRDRVTGIELSPGGDYNFLSEVELK